MESGKIYLLFLSRDKDSGRFILTGGGQGLFELSSGRHGVKPNGHSSDVLQKYKGRDAVGFLEEVKAAARKEPEPRTAVLTDCSSDSHVNPESFDHTSS